MIQSMLFMMFSILIVSCKKSGDAEGEVNYEQLRMEKEKLELERDLMLAKEKELAEAKQRAIEQAEKAKLLEEKLLRQKEDEQRKIADEKERVRLLDVAKRQQDQKVAFDGYINTKYDELELLDGKLLKSAKVTGASPVKVTFMHQNGVMRVEYSNLPEEIREICMYDVELEQIELAQIELEEKLAREKKMKVIADRASESGSSSQKNTVENRKQSTASRPATPKVSEKESTPKVVTPRGKLSIRVVGSGRGGKTIHVVAKSNVDAVLYLNDWYHPYRFHVKANEPYTHIWRNVNNKYSVKLTAKGRILDQESSNRKSGLGGNGGL